MPNCAKCSTALPVGAKFCHECGASIAPTNKTSLGRGLVAAEPKKKSNFGWWALGIFLVIVAIGTTVGRDGFVSPVATNASSPIARIAPDSDANLLALANASAAIDAGDIVGADRLYGTVVPIVDGTHASEYDNLGKSIALKKVDADLAAIGAAGSDPLIQFAGIRQSFERQTPVARDNSEVRAKYLEAIQGIVRSLSTSQYDENIAGYQLLMVIAGDDPAYSSKIDSYRKQKAAAAQQRIAAVLAGYRVEHDKFNEATFYTHGSSPRFANSRSTVFLYIGVKEKNAWLRMKTTFTASNWLFVERVDAFADGETSMLTMANFDRDNDSRIWEWSDEIPTTRQLEVLSKLAKAKDATLRFQGSTYRNDVQLSAADKQALREVIRDYDELNKLLGS